MARPKKYNEPTEVKSIRVPISKLKEWESKKKELTNKWLNQIIQNKELNCECYMDGKIFKRGKIKCIKTKSEHKF